MWILSVIHSLSLLSVLFFVETMHVTLSSCSIQLHFKISGSMRRDLVSWCFEPRQPQRITLGRNTNFTLSPNYSFHKSSYHKSCFVVVVVVF